MKLILAHNQTKQFVDFYGHLQELSSEPFDYSSYNSLLFTFDRNAAQPITVINTETHRSLTDYSGVYINGYLNNYESAVTVAICCQTLGIPYINKELHDAPSLSKLSSYAKLTAAGVRLPKTIAGTKHAILEAIGTLPVDLFPAVLKRADADRGIDNFLANTESEVVSLLADYEDSSSWLLQQFVANDGYYLVSFYGGTPAFSIYRSMGTRADGDARKAHMYKPHGGSNATLIELSELPDQLIQASQQAIAVMNRQIGSVDCLIETGTGVAYVLEVNYNPQLVTLETFKDVRVKAFLDNLKQNWE